MDVIVRKQAKVINRRRDLVMLGLLMMLGGMLLLLPTNKGSSQALRDKESVYQQYQDSGLKEVYLTVLPVDRDSSKYGYTFKELEEDVQWRDDKEVSVQVIFQEGKDGEPRNGMYGYGLTEANGVMTLRGRSTRLSPQKSYKIELNNAGGPWHGSQVVNLNKHPFDPLKVRNKLSFDYLKEIKNITALRTQFVRVYVRDYSSSTLRQEWEDYGLFVQVENVDTDFLGNHGLDPQGSLYQAENFTFREVGSLKQATEADDKQAFEKILDIKGKDSHEKLLAMLGNLNNKFLNIDDVIDKHFNRENYLTWLAVNILTGNVDTTNQNFYLYSPSDSDTWYLLPWDYDGAWGFYESVGLSRAPWQEGVTNYWGVKLHQRFLSNPKNVLALSAKIEEIREIFSEDKTKRMLADYEKVVLPFLLRTPDRSPTVGLQQIEAELERLSGIIEVNRKVYYQNLKKPMPIHLGQPQDLGEYLLFSWDKSFDLQGDRIEYRLEISKSPDFNKVVYSKGKIRETQCVVKNLAPGVYYWRVIITDEEGNQMIPFDIFEDGKGNKYYGMRRFYAN